jgi:hypothetical protein
MNTLEIKPGEKVVDVVVTDDDLCVSLMDGRTITVPLVWYPTLLHATPQNSVPTGKLQAVATASIGQMLTKI